jgi:hypothetical protein
LSVTGKTPNDHAATEAGQRRVVRPRGEQQLVPEVRRGGGLPFGQVVSQWVCDPRYSANLRTLYAILVTYADVSDRDTRKGLPYRSVLAVQLGVSESTLDRTIREGEAAGLFRVQRRTNAKTRSADANVYALRDKEFWGGEWVDPLRPGQKASDVAEGARKRRAEAKKAAGILPKGGRKKAADDDTGSDLPESEGGVMGDATSNPVENRGGGVMGDARGGVMGDARGGVMGDAVKLLVLEPDVQNQDRDLSLSPLDLDLTSRADAAEATAAKAAGEREKTAATEGNPQQGPDRSQEAPETPVTADAPEDPSVSVLAAYEAAAGVRMVNGSRARLQDEARQLLDAGYDLNHLRFLAAQMPTLRYTNLIKHAERNPLPKPRRSLDDDVTPPVLEPPKLPEWLEQTAIEACDVCDAEGYVETVSEATGLTIDARCHHDGQLVPVGWSAAADIRAQLRAKHGDRSTEKAIVACFFCENTGRRGWYRDPDDGTWIECDHADEYATN